METEAKGMRSPWHGGKHQLSLVYPAKLPFGGWGEIDISRYTEFPLHILNKITTKRYASLGMELSRERKKKGELFEARRNRYASNPLNSNRNCLWKRVMWLDGESLKKVKGRERERDRQQ